MWRPLLHAAAVAGDVDRTQAFYDEMLATCESHLFDSFKHRVSHAHNYLLLAHGYASGYAAAEALFLKARERGHVDLLTYTFMLELAFGLHSRHGRSSQIAPEGRKLALSLWQQMHEDAIVPSAQFCHKMFHVHTQEGSLEVAETLFEQMREASSAMRQSGEDLAMRWAGGDLEGVRAFLEARPLSAQSMCHTSLSYVRLIEACVHAKRADRAAHHLEALQQEASAKGIALGHELTTPLLHAFARGAAADLKLGAQLHEQSASRGRPCAAPPSLSLCNALLKQQQPEQAAKVLLDMAEPRRDQQWIFSVLAQRVAKLQSIADALPADDSRQDLVQERLRLVRVRFELEEPPAASEQAAGTAEGASDAAAAPLAADSKA